MPKQRSFQRSERLSRQLLNVLAGAVLREVRDPRVQQVQLTSVELTRDLRMARVYYVLMDNLEEDPEVQQALERAAGFLRRHVSQELQLRHVPELTFRHDASIERGRRMEALLADLNPSDAPDEES